MATKKSTKQTPEPSWDVGQSLSDVTMDLSIIERIAGTAICCGDTQEKADLLSAIQALAARAGQLSDDCAEAAGGSRSGFWDSRQAKESEAANG